MNIAPYKLVLSLPGVRLLTLVGFLARIPATAASMAITLHVLTALDLTYTEAGVAGAVAMAGMGVGAPVAGRLVDRVGLRPVLILTTAAQVVYWAFAPRLDYLPLVLLGFVSGALSIPVFTVMRQFVAALVPVAHRRTAYALDSVAVELSYMIGPALAVALVTGLNSAVALYTVGAGLVAGGLALTVLNFPTVSAEEHAARAASGPRRRWLGAPMITLLGVTAAATFVLAATEISIIALLNDSGATRWTGLVIAVWGGYSVIGGLIYGTLRHEISPLALTTWLGLSTVPLGLVGGSWWWLLAALIPAGMLCAPSLSATTNTVSQWVPAQARGEAMGLHGAALTAGIATGAPIAGAVIDAFGPAWGFAAAGGVGTLLVLVALPFWPRLPSPATRPA